MKVLVLRDKSEIDWTLSRFYFDDKEMGVGVEDEDRQIKVHGETRIPDNIYKLGLRVSPHFSYHYFRDDEGNLIKNKDRTTVDLQKKFHTPHEMIWVMNVPGFEFILWHWGNTDEDTEGCYIVGSYFAKLGKQKGVAESRKKYEEIYPILWQAIKAGEVTVEYRSKK